jgi:hypothetical protein
VNADGVKHAAILSPAGEQMRASAERVMRARFATLRERGERRELTPVERHELDGLGIALDELLQLEAPRTSSAGTSSAAAIRSTTSEGQ